MIPRNRLPVMTKIYLAILVWLASVFVVLILIRSNLAPATWLALCASRKTDAAATMTAVITSTTTGPSPAISAAVASNTPKVTADTTTEIRSGPGSGYALLGYLEAGQEAPVIGKSSDNRWYAVRLPYIEGGQGWVNASGVKVENAGGVPVVSGDNTETQADKPTVLAIANVNVRSGPGMSYNTVSLLQNGQTLEVVGMDENGFWWAVVLPNGGQGWVSRDYVVARNVANVPVIEPKAGQGQPVVPTPAAGAPTLTAITMVNIRGGPGTLYAVVGRLEQGQAAEVVGISSDKRWWAIKVPSMPNGIGWVAVGFVKVVGAEKVPYIR